MKVKFDNGTVAILIVGIIVVAFAQGWLSIPDLGLNFNIQFPGQEQNTGDGDGDDGGDGQPYTPPSSSRAPTSLACFLSPNPGWMGGAFYGTVSSNGQNYPIEITVKHKGSGDTQTIPATLGADGKYELITQINTPGHWQAWASADGGAVKSNVVEFTVQGLLIVPEANHYSKTFRDSMVFRVYGSWTGNAQIIAYDHDAAISIPVTSTVINSGGYGDFSVGLDSWGNGDYEFDVLIAGQKATDYGGSGWVTVGR